MRERPTLPCDEVDDDFSQTAARQLGPYRLAEPLGSGSMGRVYRAEHVVLGRCVAIKTLRPELASDAACVDRFIAEARAVNLLNHPHVIQVTDIASGPHGSPWFVMELLEGADLAMVALQEPMSVARALRIVRQVCDALEAIHAVGIVHRDVKPENIFVTRVDGRDFVKLIDFGVARLHDPRNAEPIRTEGLVGTPQYMAPEQSHAGELDHRADLYAVGAVLFELLSGETPFPQAELPAMLDDLLNKPAPRLSDRAKLPAAVRAQLDRLVARCLAKRPAERPQSAREIACALESIMDRLEPAAEREPVRVFSLPPSQATTVAVAHGAAPSSKGLLRYGLAWGVATAAALIALSMLRAGQATWEEAWTVTPAPLESSGRANESTGTAAGPETASAAHLSASLEVDAPVLAEPTKTATSLPVVESEAVADVEPLAELGAPVAHSALDTAHTSMAASDGATTDGEDRERTREERTRVREPERDGVRPAARREPPPSPDPPSPAAALIVRPRTEPAPPPAIPAPPRTLTTREQTAPRRAASRARTPTAAPSENEPDTTLGVLPNRDAVLNPFRSR